MIFSRTLSRHLYLKNRLTPSLLGRLMLLVLLSLLPAFGFLAYLTIYGREHARDHAQESALQLVRTAALEQKELIAATRQQLITLAQLPIVQRADWGALCSKTFAELRPQYPYYSNLGVADLLGNLRCSAVPLKKPVNIADRSYFREALAKIDFALSSYQIGRVTGRSVITAGYPIRDNLNKTHGVVFIAIDLQPRIENIASTLKFNNGSTLLVVSERGTVLARHPDPEAWIGKSLPDNPLIRHVIAQRDGGNIEETGLDGVSRLHVYAPIHQSVEGQTWLVAGIPTGIIYRDVNTKLLTGLAMLTLVTLLVLAIGRFGADYLVIRPARVLIRATEQLGRGDLSARTDLAHAGGELGALAQSMDRMADHLEQKQHELQRVNRALRTLSAGNRTLLKATEERALLNDMCRVIVESGRYRLAMVHYTNDDPHHPLEPMAVAGSGGEEPCEIATTALNTRKPCVIGRKKTDPLATNRSSMEYDYGLGAAFPLVVHGQPIGVLSIFADEQGAFDQQEFDLLAEAADDLAFGIETLRTRAAHAETRETLYRLTHTDTVTGLPNETQFSESLIAAIHAAEQHNTSFTLLQLDIERLREINDALGFSHGDELLRQFGERLHAYLPQATLVARLRGDEFAALIPDTTTNAVLDTAQRLHAELTKPFLIADIPLDVPSHIGIVLFPGHGTTPHDLFRHADLAMQQAKKRSTGYTLFDSSMKPYQPRQLAMAGELRRAIENGDLLLYLQPKVEMTSGRVCGVEGLVRWQHMDRGLIPPGEFIGLAEHTGLIKPLTEWVIEAALRLQHAWQSDSHDLPIAVNLSVRNLREENLLEKIKNMRAAWGAHPGQLELEITESAIMDDTDHALRVLNLLRDDGIPLHIDDFGTGYSSLSYLQKLPVEAVKIDQTFVRNMAASKDSLLIVRSTIDLVHDLGRKVVAEGVETREIWDMLAALGCDIAQGYYIARPMHADEFPGWQRQFRPPQRT